MRTRCLCLSLLLAACGGDRAAGPTGEGESESEAESEGEPDPTDALFAPDHIVEISIDIEPDDWDALRVETRDLVGLLDCDRPRQPFGSPFTYFPARVTVDGTTFENVGVRKKGFLGSLDDVKPSLKVKFDEYVPAKRYLGLSGLTLNNSKQDPSYLHQCLSYATFTAAGVPASRCNFAHVVVNGADLGLYVHVERVGKDLLRRHFPDEDGNLYEGTLSDFRPEFVDMFEKKTNEADPYRGDLDAVVEAAAEGDATLLDALEAVVDTDEFFRFWATEGLIGHWDGYASNTNNFFVYFDPTDGRASFLPWGVDGAMQQVGPFEKEGVLTSIAIRGYLARRLWLREDTRARYVAEMQDLLDAVWDEDALLGEIARMEELVTPVVAAAGAESPAWPIAEVRAFVGGRRATVLGELTPVAPVWDQPLGGPPCIDFVGDVSATFDTTFGTLDDDDPFGSGTGTLDATLDGEALVTTAIGAIAGWDTKAPEDPPAIAGTVAALPDGRVAVVAIAVPSGLFFSGAVFGLGWAAVGGGLFIYDPADDSFELRGFMFEGWAALDSAGTTDGDAVIGSLQATLIRFPE